MDAQQLKALAEQYKRAQQAGDLALAQLAQEAVKAAARAEGASAEARVMAAFVQDA